LSAIAKASTNYETAEAAVHKLGDMVIAGLEGEKALKAKKVENTVTAGLEGEMAVKKVEGLEKVEGSESPSGSSGQSTVIAKESSGSTSTVKEVAVNAKESDSSKSDSPSSGATDSGVTDSSIPVSTKASPGNSSSVGSEFMEISSVTAVSMRMPKAVTVAMDGMDCFLSEFNSYCPGRFHTIFLRIRLHLKILNRVVILTDMSK
jgi:hypothetical protein